MAYQIPLFPLNTVLFPGMPLSLHIFEERYRQMIHECRQSGQPFGVVLIKEGVEALGPLAQPHRVGCTAEIAQLQTLNDGRMDILAVGRERFQIVSLSYDQPYLQGTVEQFPLTATLNRDTVLVSTRLRPWLEEYLGLLSTAGDVEFDASSLPTDPETLAYLAATVLQIPNDQKQVLLATDRAETLLQDMRGIFRRELPVLRLLLEEEKATPGAQGPFSLN
jgi:Lon protease-like protein